MLPAAALARGNACLRCRKKKSKCDGIKPVCSPCERSGHSCECRYVEPPRSRIQQLYDKISDLESKLHDLQKGKHSPRSEKSNSPTPSTPRTPAISIGGTSMQLSGVGPISPVTPTSNGVSTSNGTMPVSPSSSPPPIFNGEVTPQQKEMFIQAFFANRDKCCFEMSIDRFRQGLSLPLTDPRSPHPALVNAILLLGCYFTRSPYLSRYEPHYLQLVYDELSQIMAHSDHYSGYVFYDFVRASNLVAFFLCFKGCYNEASTMATQASNIAITCELHQISPSVRRSPSREESEQFLPPPRDNIELGERIHAWWQTFMLDKLLSIICGFPSNLSNGLDSDARNRITTPWPRLMSEYEMGHISEVENTSVGHLYSNFTPSRYARPETLVGLRAQGMSLVAQATQICRNYPPNMSEVRAADAAIQRFITKLPDLRAGGESGEMNGQPGISSVNPRLVMIHTLAHAALLILHQHGADQVSRHRVATATQSIVSIISEVRDQDYMEMFNGLGHIWCTCGEIIIKICRNSQGTTRDTTGKDLQNIMLAIKKLSFTYIVLGLRLRELECNL